MEKKVIVPDDQKFLASVIEDVAQGFQVQLLRKGKPVAVVVPLSEPSNAAHSDFLESYNRFRQKFDLDHLDLDFEKEMESVRYRQQSPGRKFEW